MDINISFNNILRCVSLELVAIILVLSANKTILPFLVAIFGKPLM